MIRALVLFALAASLGAQVKLPSYSREVLGNGAIVYLAPNKRLPLVNFRVIVRGGQESEPEGLAGLASITAELLRKGTGKRTADSFSDELDGLGGTFFSGADGQATEIAAEFLAKDFEQGLGLLADAILHPTFPEAEVRKELGRRTAALASMKDNPGMAIRPYSQRFFYGTGHPYGRISDEASLDRIRRDDVAGYHRKLYAGSNLIVIVTGDFEAQAARTRIAATFGSLPAGARWNWIEDRPPSPASPRLLLVDKPEATQTYFVIAQPGVRRTSPDLAVLQLVNQLFGGRFTSMLNDELRVNSGLTYGAACEIQQQRLTGAIAISSYTKTETTAQAIDLALTVLGRLASQGLTEAQLASAKTYMKGNYAPRRLQTSDQVAALLGELELNGLGRGEVDELFARIDGVTLEQANLAARRYYRRENLTFTLVGDAAKIRTVVAKYAPKMEERSFRRPGW